MSYPPIQPTCLAGYLDAQLTGLLLDHHPHGGREDGDSSAVGRIGQDDSGAGHAGVDAGHLVV